MDIEYFHRHCLKKKGVEESFPFGGNILVFKVFGKMFALTDLDNFTSIHLKCLPERAVELREQYAGILPGYHLNKKHWNTMLMDGTIPDHVIIECIDNSYDLVVAGLPSGIRAKLKG